MSTGNFWLCDEEKRVLGPVGLEVVRELFKAGRLTVRTLVMREGAPAGSWSQMTALPELADLFAADAAEKRLAEERAQAKKIDERIRSLRDLPPHAVFGVPTDAPLDDYRAAFFRLSKAFHPDRLPETAAPELKDACALAFRFLSGLLVRVENGLQRIPAPRNGAKPDPQQSAPPRSFTPAPDRYAPESFVGLVPESDGYAATVKVTARSAGMFVEHPLVNIKQSGFYVASETVLPIGTNVKVNLQFDDTGHTIQSRGRVSLEAARGAKVRGFGVTMSQLDPKDRRFIEEYLQMLGDEESKK